MTMPAWDRRNHSALDDRVLHWIEGTVKTPYWDIAAALYFPPGCDECASVWLANSINADR